MFTSSVLYQKSTFWANLIKKIKNRQFKQKFGTKTNLNMRNSITMFKLSVFDRKYFFGKFSPKNQNCQFELKFRTTLISICRIMQKIWDVHFFCFRPEKLFLGKPGQKDQNRQFQHKFSTKTNLNMRNSMMMFTFSVFDHKYLSQANLVKKMQNCLFKVKFDTRTNSNMQNSMVVSILFDQAKNNYPFQENQLQKLVIVSLS